jgi:hypothetical protein
LDRDSSQEVTDLPGKHGKYEFAVSIERGVERPVRQTSQQLYR